MKHLIAVLMVAPAFGVGFFPKAVESKLFFTPSKVVKRSFGNCTDFSGKWKGTCKVTQNGTDTVMPDQHQEIAQQGCEVISTGTMPTFIGGTQNFGFVIPIPQTPGTTVGAVAMDSSASASWNTARTELSLAMAFQTKAIGDSPASIVTGTGYMKLDNARLISHIDMGATAVATCEFDKE